MISAAIKGPGSHANVKIVLSLRCSTLCERSSTRSATPLWARFLLARANAGFHESMPTTLSRGSASDAHPVRGNEVRWRPGGLRSLAAAVHRHQHRCTAPTERTPSRESPCNGPSVRGNDDRWPLEGCGPSQPRCAAIHAISRRRRSGRPPGSRPAMAHPFVATMIGSGLEGCGPSQPRFADINTASRRRRSGRPPGSRPAMAIGSWQR